MKMVNDQKKNQKKRTVNLASDTSNNNINNISTNSNIINTNSNNNENNQDKEKDKDIKKEDTDESILSVDEDDNKKFPFDLFVKFLKIIFNTLKEAKDLKELKDIKEIKQNDNNNSIDLYTIINKCNSCLLTIIEKYNMKASNIKQLEEVLMEYLSENKELLINVIKWIEKFFNKFGEDAFSREFNKFIERFSFIAIYKDEEIFEKGIKTLCNIEKCRKSSINVIILNILNKLKEKDNNFAIKRATEFVKVLCKELSVKHVYLTFADVLSKNKSDFNCKIINILNYFLLTSSDTEELRNLLKNIQKTTNEEDKSFFEKLFSTWCINPVSCLILCLIAEDFELSHHLLIKFGEVKLKLIQENYLEYAQLVNVLESRSFLNIRIYLLQPKKHKYLVKTLYGILFILPQGKAYQTLFNRLKHVEVMSKLDTSKPEKGKNNEQRKKDIKKFMNIFDSTHGETEVSLKDSIEIISSD